MFPFSHTYVLNLLYEGSDRPIPKEMIIGNILADIVVDVNLRKKTERDYQRDVHDKIRGPDLGGVSMETDLEKGLAVHIMTDNFSRVTADLERLKLEIFSRKGELLYATEYLF